MDQLEYTQMFGRRIRQPFRTTLPIIHRPNLLELTAYLLLRTLQLKPRTSRGAQGSSTLIQRRTPLSFSFSSLLKVSRVKERAKLVIQSGQSIGFGGIDRKMARKQCCFNS